VSKSFAKVGIALGVIFIFVGALDVRQHFGAWGAASVLFGLFLIAFGSSLFVRPERKKITRRVSFGFLGAGLVLLAIALATTS
jgi:peptidoglycan biosynthesis protein MviN/MurJ (putative lipid II flippase)